MPRSSLSDKRKLIIAVSLLLCAGFVLTTLVNYYVSKSAIRESIVSSELPLTSDNIYSEIQKDLIRPIFISSMMASDTFLRDWVLSGEKDDGQVSKYLKEIKARYSTFSSFFISDHTRRYYTGEGLLKTVDEAEPRDQWYFRVRRMKEPYEINVDPDLANKDALTIFINFRVFDYSQQFIGATGVGLTVDAVRTLINSYQARYKRAIYFVDIKGNITLFGNDTHLPGSSIREIEGLGALAGQILGSRDARSYQYQGHGSNHLLNVRYIPELNWFLFVERTEDDALTEIRRTLVINLTVCALITGIVLLLTSLTINRYQSRLEEMATTDKLTGLSNRQAFEILAPQAVRESRRSGAPLASMLMDIDHFKAINDQYGHLAGDAVIQGVARTVRDSLRDSDILCRWGGEEFLAILKACEQAAALELAEKIRETVESQTFAFGDHVLRVTVSIGVASGNDEATLVSEADRSMYAAKEAGRNCVRSQVLPG